MNKINNCFYFALCANSEKRPPQQNWQDQRKTIMLILSVVKFYCKKHLKIIKSDNN